MAGTKTLRVGVLTPVTTLDPRDAQDFVSAFAVLQVYETPFAQPRAAGVSPEPILFQERLRPERPSDGAPVFSAAVRPDILFSDGTPLTAQHVADSLSKASTFLEQADVVAHGDRVYFRLKRPNARFDLVLTRRFCNITRETTREAGGTLLGTGPFLPAQDATPERMRLVRNPYYRNPPALDEVVFVVYPLDENRRPEALLAALDAGEVDFSNVLSREDILRLKNVRRWTEPGSSTALLYMNTDRPGLGDPRVRRAIALSIDRREIARMFYATASAFTATGLLPPILSQGGPQGGQLHDGLVFDRRKARELLAQPGVRKPERLQLLLIFGPRPYLPNPQQVGEYIAARLGELGIEVEIVPTATVQEYQARTQHGDYDLALAGWIADTLDPVDFLEAILGSESIPVPHRKTIVGANLSRWHDPETDRTLAKLRQDPRGDLRAAFLRRIGEEAPFVPLMYGAAIFAHGPRVKNLFPSPLGKPSFAGLDLEK